MILPFTQKMLQARYNADDVGTISHGNNFFVWNGYWENDPETKDSILDNYATVYLFFQWLRVHASNGTGIYTEILNSSYRDYRAVTTAAETWIDGAYFSWEALIRTWLAANYLGLGSGHLGYKTELAVSAPLNGRTELNGVAWYFSPGESIYREVAGEYNPTTVDTNTRYVGFTTGLSSLDTDVPYAGNVVMTFNANSNNAGEDEAASLAPLSSIALQQSLMGRSLASASYTPPKSYAVDVNLGTGGGLHPDSHQPRTSVAGARFDKTVNPFSADAKRNWSRR